MQNIRCPTAIHLLYYFHSGTHQLSLMDALTFIMIYFVFDFDIKTQYIFCVFCVWDALCGHEIYAYAGVALVSVHVGCH